MAIVEEGQLRIASLATAGPHAGTVVTNADEAGTNVYRRGLGLCRHQRMGGDRWTLA
jgi:hypothetical protein